jgi:hypothetical protein
MTSLVNIGKPKKATQTDAVNILFENPSIPIDSD